MQNLILVNLLEISVKFSSRIKQRNLKLHSITWQGNKDLRASLKYYFTRLNRTKRTACWVILIAVFCQYYRFSDVSKAKAICSWSWRVCDVIMLSGGTRPQSQTAINEKLRCWSSVTFTLNGNTYILKIPFNWPCNQNYQVPESIWCLATR